MVDYKKSESKDWAKSHLKGQWSTLVTPFTVDGSLDVPGLISNTNHIVDLGVSGLGCTWGMGEFWSLTLEEKFEIYDLVSEHAGNKIQIAAHVTHSAVEDMLKLAEKAQNTGFDLLIVTSPYIVAKSPNQVFEFVSKLAESTDLAIMFYNSPQFGIVLQPDWLKKICAIQNVVGVKEASFDRELSINTHLLIGDEVVISTPDEWIFFKGNEMGFQQQVMFANTSDWRFDTKGNNNYVNFVDNAVKGNLNKEFYDNRIKPIKAVSDKWWMKTVQKNNGVLPVALCKYWGELMGMAGGSPRLPLFDLNGDEKKQLKIDITNARDQIVINIKDNI